jgi:hypothetical protein
MDAGAQSNVHGAKLILAGLPIAALCMWFGFLATTMYYDATRPHEPDASAGRLIALNTHGSIVYLTPQEQLIRICIGLGAVAFIIGALVLKQLKLRLGPLGELPVQTAADYEKVRATYRDKKPD